MTGFDPAQRYRKLRPHYDEIDATSAAEFVQRRLSRIRDEA